MSESYPQNWKALCEQIAQARDWTCEYCGQLGKLPGERGATRSESCKWALQVHHLDRNPQNNHPDNLMLVHAGCHLILHRAERKGVRSNNGQLTLFDFSKLT